MKKLTMIMAIAISIFLVISSPGIALADGGGTGGNINTVTGAGA